MEKRIEDYVGREMELGDVVKTMCRNAYRAGALEQMDIDAGKMKALNEEWEHKLKIQWDMLIDKACEYLKFSTFPRINVDVFRKYMERQ